MDRYDQCLQTQLVHKTIILKASGALRLHTDLELALRSHTEHKKHGIYRGISGRIPALIIMMFTLLFGIPRPF